MICVGSKKFEQILIAKAQADRRKYLDEWWGSGKKKRWDEYLEQKIKEDVHPNLYVDDRMDIKFRR